MTDYLSGTGLASLADDTEEDKERYITETFGPHLKNVPYGGPAPDVYEGPWPHPEGEPSLIDDESELTREEQIEQVLEDPGIRTDADFLLGLDDEQKKIDDYYGKSEEGEMVFADEPKDDLFVAPPDERPAVSPYAGREVGIGQLMNEMPSCRKSDWEDYLKYVQRLGDMPGGHLEYDEWQRMMRRRR